jgi:hypothetical protein
MAEAVLAFQEIRRKISSATLVEMNKTLIYDDVGIALMTHAMEMCATHFGMDAQKINASSSVNFITTRLYKTKLAPMLDWNGTGGGFVQKPDAVFQMFFDAPGGTRKEMLIYYESDAGDKNNVKDQKQAARKLFQSTCGCREVNQDLPAISVRANVFSGPRPEELVASDKYERTKVQMQAQNALDFLHQLLVAHMWICCQICLLVKGKGNLVNLATQPGTRDLFDLHFLVGHISWANRPDNRMRLFDNPGVEVRIEYTEYKVAGAALIQVLSIQRCNTTTISNAVLTVLGRPVAVAGAPVLNGMLTVQDLWHLLQCCVQHVNSFTGVAAIAAVPPQIIAWVSSGARVVGLPGVGIARQAARSAPTFMVCPYINPLAATASPEWIAARNLVAEYYDASCKGLYDAIFVHMRWLPLGAENKNYLKDLKKLKAESRRDGSVLQSRSQAASLASLGMENGLGISKGPNHNLNSLCMLSLLDTLPRIDPRLEVYVASFNAPNISLFLRFVRCTNLLAFEHMAKTHATAKWSDQFQHSLGFFPAGTAADIDYIMQYTLSNANAVHSLYLAPTPGLSAAQSDNVVRPETYAWLSALIDEIILDARKHLHSRLRDSPLRCKLLLCHKMVYALLHSVEIEGPPSTAAIVPVPTSTDVRQMQKKIITSLMTDKIMYYIDSVDRHSEIVWTQRLQGGRETTAMTTPPTPLRAFRANATPYPLLQLPTQPLVLQPTVFQQPTETDAEHATRIATTPIKYTRLTWPLRDLNVYTRISMPEIIVDPQGSRKEYPYNFSYVDDGQWNEDEKSSFAFLQSMQDHDAEQQAARNQQLEDGVPLANSDIVLPDDIVRHYYQRETAGYTLLRLCEVQAEDDDRVYVNPSNLAVLPVLQAYRWKAMLIQATLLSALNGICFELKSQGVTPHHIHRCKIVGLEHNWASTDKLILQNFVFEPQEDEPAWFAVWTGVTVWDRLRRFGMRHLFRERRLTTTPDSPPELTTFDHDLTQFLFGMIQVVAGKRIRYLWRRDGTDIRTFTAEAHEASFRGATENEYSSRIESSLPLYTSAAGPLVAGPQNSNWYEYLWGNA